MINAICHCCTAYGNYLSCEQKKESEDINNMMNDLYQEAGSTLLEEPKSSMVFMDLHRQDEDHIRKINEFQAYLDMVLFFSLTCSLFHL